MKKLLQIMMIAGVCACLINICHAQNDDITMLKKQNAGFINALVNRDTATLSKILADDFMLVNPGGQKTNKAHNLAMTISSAQKVLSDNIDSVEVRLLTSDVGVVSCWTTYVIEANGAKTTGRVCYQDVYVKSNGMWKAESGHVASLSTP